jgi:hypothetical protein
VTKVIVRAEVKSVDQWKEGFVSHAELFRDQKITVIHYGVGEGNLVVACFETSDLDTFMDVMNSPSSIDAMSNDGIVEGSVEIFVADMSFEP